MLSVDEDEDPSTPRLLRIVKNPSLPPDNVTLLFGKVIWRGGQGPAYKYKATFSCVANTDSMPPA